MSADIINMPSNRVAELYRHQNGTFHIKILDEKRSTLFDIDTQLSDKTVRVQMLSDGRVIWGNELGKTFIFNPETGKTKALSDINLFYAKPILLESGEMIFAMSATKIGITQSDNFKKPEAVLDFGEGQRHPDIVDIAAVAKNSFVVLYHHQYAPGKDAFVLSYYKKNGDAFEKMSDVDLSVPYRKSGQDLRSVYLREVGGGQFTIAERYSKASSRSEEKVSFWKCKNNKLVSGKEPPQVDIPPTKRKTG